MIPRPRFPGAVAHSDARLVELARSGDERAFELIVRRHRPALVAYARRLGLGEGRAEDAVQQAVLSAWLALCRGDEVRDVGAWLGRITHNRAVNLLRTGARAQNLDPELEPAPSAPFLDERLALRQTLEDLAALPPRQRDALVLSALEGRSYEEVASALGVSPGAVRGLLHRARETLRAAASALAPVPLMRAAGGGLRRAGLPAGRVAEVAGPGSAAATPVAAVRAAAAAAATAVLAAGVAVGPGLISAPPRHAKRASAAPGGGGHVADPHPVTPAHAGASSERRLVAGSPVATKRRLTGSAHTQPAPQRGSSAPAPERGPARHVGGEGGAGTEETAPSSTFPAAAVASSPSVEQAPEAPASSAPAPEPAPVTVEAEAPRTREAPEKEKEALNEAPAPAEPEPAPGKDN